MTITKENDKLTILSGNYDREKKYAVSVGHNGKNYVTIETVSENVLHVSEGNSKTGNNVFNFNFPIEYTCKHSCECYKNGSCYACNGCYNFASNQAIYSENYNFFRNSTEKEFTDAIQTVINELNYKLFRYFTCGDIPNQKFVDCMVKLAKDNPDIMFWSYTKKYEIINRWIDENGNLPENLTIIFSHWMNENGSYFPMNNPHNLPTSEFIPLGKEYLTETVTHICPCSDPSVIATCATCENPCYKLKKGQSMGLLEHSTKQTKERDKKIRTAKENLKKENKQAKKSNGKKGK